MNKKEYSKQYYYKNREKQLARSKHRSTKFHKYVYKKYENPDTTPDSFDVFEENEKRFQYGKPLIY